MRLIVHGEPRSPFVRKVRAALGEKGLDYELKNLVMFPKTPELLALTPLGKMPVLEDTDTGFSVPESSVICAYLERIRPEPRLYPEEPEEFARALYLEAYSDAKLPEVLSPIGFERVVKPKLLKREPDEAVVKNALDNLVPPVFDYLESRLDDGADMLLSTLSIADLAVGTQLQSLGLAGEEIDATRWPRLARYATGLLARPSFQNALR